LTLLFVGLLFVAGHAGCGEDTDSESSATTIPAADITIPFWDNGPRSISRVDYLKRANAICQRGRNQMPRSFEERYRGVSSGKLYDEATSGVFLPGIQLWFDDIAYLGAPPGDRSKVEDLLIAMQRGVYESEEAQPIFSPEELKSHFAESNRLTGAYGLASCLVEGVPFEPS